MADEKTATIEKTAAGWRSFLYGRPQGEQEILRRIESPEQLRVWCLNHGITNPEQITELTRAWEIEAPSLPQGVEQQKEEGPESAKSHKALGYHTQHNLHDLKFEDFEKEADKHAEKKAEEWEKTKDTTKAQDKNHAHTLAKQAFYDDFVDLNLKGTTEWRDQLAKEGKAPSPHLNEAIRKHEEKQTAKMSQQTRSPMKNLTRRITYPRTSFSPSLIVRQNFVSPLSRGLGRGVGRIGSAISNLGRRIIGSAAKLAVRTIGSLSLSGIVALVGFVLSPLVVFCLVFFILGAAVVGLFFFFFPKGGGPYTVPGGMTYYVNGPDEVKNGQDVTYGITLVYDPDHPPTSFPDLNAITLIDNLPNAPWARFVSATGTYEHSLPSRVTWRLASNKPTGGLVGLGNSKVYSFQLTIRPANDVTITNRIGVQ